MSKLYKKIVEMENKVSEQRESLKINLEKMGYVLANAKDGDLVAYGYEPQDRDYKIIFGRMGALSLGSSWISYIDVEPHGISLPLLDSVDFSIKDPVGFLSAGNQKKSNDRLGFFTRTLRNEKVSISTGNYLMVGRHIPSEMKEKYKKFLSKHIDLIRSGISFF